MFDPEGAAVVREIFEQYASGKTVTEIIQSLNARQIKTSKGKAFNKNSLHRLLRNRRYIGYYIYKGVQTPNGMPGFWRMSFLNGCSISWTATKKLLPVQEAGRSICLLPSCSVAIAGR